MGNTVVIGTTFVDLKEFAKYKYEPQGCNLGEVKIVHGGVGRNVVENFANVGMPVSYMWACWKIPPSAGMWNATFGISGQTLVI